MNELQVILSVSIALGGLTFFLYAKNIAKSNSSSKVIKTEDEDMLLIEKAKELAVQIQKKQGKQLNEVKKLEDPELKKQAFLNAYLRFNPNKENSSDIPPSEKHNLSNKPEQNHEQPIPSKETAAIDSKKTATNEKQDYSEAEQKKLQIAESNRKRLEELKKKAINTIALIQEKRKQKERENALSKR